MNTNSYDIHKLRINLADSIRANDSTLTERKIKNKAELIINQAVSLSLYDTLTNHINAHGYKDLHLKPISIQVKSSIKDNYYCYEIEVNNDNFNINDKAELLNELYNKATWLEFDNSFVSAVKSNVKTYIN